MKNIRDLDVANKKILVRCDFNVPLDERGDILDDFKIKESLPTIRYLLANKAKIVLMSHLGNPEGKVIAKLKLDKVRDRIESLLDIPIMKSFDCVGRDVENQLSRLKKGEIMLLENLRFHNEEIDNDAGFAQKLSHLGQGYVNDAFAECHRNYASIACVPKLMPSAAGLLLEKEVNNLKKILHKPKKPFIIIMGGKKAQTKASFISHISNIADFILIGGLLKKEIQEKSIKFRNAQKIIGPADSLSGLDIGAKTIKLFSQKIASAKTILWNGPLGKFEEGKYQKGTLAIARAIIESGAFCVVGGGETVEFLNKEGLLDKFSHVSTGGGAMLEFLSTEKLPGLEVLK